MYDLSICCWTWYSWPVYLCVLGHTLHMLAPMVEMFKSIQTQEQHWWGCVAKSRQLKYSIPLHVHGKLVGLFVDYDFIQKNLKRNKQHEDYQRFWFREIWMLFFKSRNAGWYWISCVWFIKASANYAVIDSDIDFPPVLSEAIIWTSTHLLVLAYCQFGHLVSNFILTWINIQHFHTRKRMWKSCL